MRTQARDVRLLFLREDVVYPNTLQDNVATYTIIQPGYVWGGGIIPLVQAFMSNLLTTPGTDKTSPIRGAGLLKLLREVRVANDRLGSEIATRIREAEQFMLEEQRNLRLTPDERLASAGLLSLTPGREPDVVFINVSLVTESGQTATILI